MSVTQIEEGAVLHRHRRAMALVQGVEDVDARYALLEYVVSGNRAIEDAMRAMQTRRRSPLRRAAAIELRARGLTLREIAVELGCVSESTASRLLRSAV